MNILQKLEVLIGTSFRDGGFSMARHGFRGYIRNHILQKLGKKGQPWDQRFEPVNTNFTGYTHCFLVTRAAGLARFVLWFGF